MICNQKGCTRESRVAIQTSRPRRDVLTTKVWWDDRDPTVTKKAERLCKEHGLQTLAAIGDVLIDIVDNAKEADDAHDPC